MKRKKDSISGQIGLKIQMLRKQMGLTQQEFAKKLDYTKVTIARWEIGALIPDVPTLYKIAKLTNVNVLFFFGENNTLSNTSRVDNIEAKLNQFIEIVKSNQARLLKIEKFLNKKT